MKIKKFDRYEPDERKALLISSALRCLISEGYSGLSVRKITKEANVSQGLVNHHFGSVYNLIAQTYNVISNDFLQSVQEQIQASSGSAAEKLDIFFRENFSEEALDPDLLKAWLVFWSLIRDSQEMADTYNRVNNETLSLLEELLTNISVEEKLSIDNISMATQSLMALLDGLWVRETLFDNKRKSENKESYDALTIARNWLKGYRAEIF